MICVLPGERNAGTGASRRITLGRRMPGEICILCDWKIDMENGITYKQKTPRMFIRRPGTEQGSSSVRRQNGGGRIILQE